MNTEIASLAECLEMSDKIAAGQAVSYRSCLITGTVAKAPGYGSFTVTNNVGEVIAAGLGYICHAVEAADLTHVQRAAGSVERTVGEVGYW